MYRWFLENVYRPAGGCRGSLLAALAPFVISGLLHEYLYAVTFRFVTGYVLAFFLLQGVAAALTRQFKPTGWLAVPAILLTFAFNTLSTVLLFLPIDERIPFYVNDVPKWMHLRCKGAEMEGNSARSVPEYGFRSDNIVARTSKRLHGNRNRV
jgi:hypothetical protein